MSTQLISEQLIARFNAAAELSREGKFDAALTAWDDLLAGSPGAVLTGNFLGQLYMRKAWALMDLGRYHEAREVFEHPVLQPCLGQFSTETLFECYYSYANTLGLIGDIPGMDNAFTKAMNLAAEQLGDTGRVSRCWNNLFTHAESVKAWSYILREVDTCIVYADKHDPALALIARLNRALALFRTGRNDEAMEIVTPVQARARAEGDHKTLAMCSEILDG